MRREIARLDADRQRLAREEQGVLARLDALSADARYLDARLEELRLLTGETEAALAETASRQAEAQARLAEARDRLRSTVRVLQQVGWAGRLRAVLAASDTGRLSAGLRTTHELSYRQLQTVTAIRNAERELARLRLERESREAELRSLTERTRASRDDLAAAIDARRRLLAGIREQAAVRDAAIGELGRAAERLEAIVSGAAPAGAVSLDVRRFKGVLPLPVEGTLARPFGDRIDRRFGTRLPHPGWDLDAEFAAKVASPFDGRVVYADWLKGYGLLTVIDHGHGVHTVLAHLSALLVQPGAAVTQGQTIGRVGDTGSLEGAFLYLEVRVNGKAEDPARWFAPR